MLILKHLIEAEDLGEDGQYLDVDPFLSTFPFTPTVHPMISEKELRMALDILKERDVNGKPPELAIPAELVFTLDSSPPASYPHPS